MINELQARLPRLLKWCFTGAGAAAGWYYADRDASTIPLSYVIGGAAVGFCLIAGLFAGLRLLKFGAGAGAVLLVINYALLIPYGYGDQMPGWIATGKAAARWLNPAPLLARWGMQDDQIRPVRR